MGNASKIVLGNPLIRGDLALGRLRAKEDSKQAERKLLGLTQDGFARDCGLNRSHFAGIERGERNLTFVVLCKICKQLRCDIANVTRGIPRSSYVRDT